MYKLRRMWMEGRHDQYFNTSHKSLSSVCYKMINDVIRNASNDYEFIELLNDTGKILLHWDRSDGLWYSFTVIEDLARHSALQGQIKSIGRMIVGGGNIVERI